MARPTTLAPASARALLLVFLAAPAIALADGADGGGGGGADDVKTTAATATTGNGGDDPFAAAPRCPTFPRASTATRDREGRLWGYSGGGSCAFKEAAQGGGGETPQQLDAWETAFACGDAPAARSSSRDPVGRLWGWDAAKGRSCAYKDEKSGRPRFYDNYEPGDWLAAPACPTSAQSSSVASLDPSLSAADTSLKTWSWGEFPDGPRLCAAKDDRQAPLPFLPSSAHVRLTFADAPACARLAAADGGGGGGAPTPENSRPDREGLLWGWRLGRPCAYKQPQPRPMDSEGQGRAAAPVPIFYSGYRQGGPPPGPPPPPPP
jgi:hypothetical protein